MTDPKVFHKHSSHDRRFMLFCRAVFSQRKKPAGICGSLSATCHEPFFSEV